MAIFGGLCDVLSAIRCWNSSYITAEKTFGRFHSSCNYTSAYKTRRPLSVTHEPAMKLIILINTVVVYSRGVSDLV
jgi:hypothetical protein